MYDHAVIDGLKIHHRRHAHGVAPTLVLTNAWPQNIHCWDSTWEGMAGHFNLLAYDMPGFGRSEGRPELMRPSEQGRFMLKVMAHFGMERVHGIGPDVGAPAMLWLAAQYPERLESIVVVDGPGYAPPRYSWTLRALIGSRSLRALATVIGGPFARAAMRQGYVRYRPTQAAQQDYQVCNGDRTRFRLGLEYLASFPQELPAISKRLRSTRRPVLVLWGGRDRFLPEYNGRALVQELSRARLEVFEDCGHFLQGDAGALFVERLVQWCGDGHLTLLSGNLPLKDTARFYAII